MASEGPKSAGTGANDAAYGSHAWSDPGNIAADDGNQATTSTTAATDTNYLKATNFGFGIPAGATIDGIVVEAQAWEAAGSGSDRRVRIVKGGTVGSTDKSLGSAWASSDGTYRSWGASNDLWGETWSATDINASDFGVVISARTGSSFTLRVDHIRITVHYTEAAGGGSILPLVAVDMRNMADMCGMRG